MRARVAWSKPVAASSGWRVGGASPRRAAGTSPVGVLLAPSTVWGDPRDRTREGCHAMRHAPRGRSPLPRRAAKGPARVAARGGTRRVVEAGCSVERVARGRGIPTPRRRRLSRWSALGAEHGVGRPTRQDPRGLSRDEARASWSKPIAASSSERTREGCRARRHASRGRNRLQRRAGGAWEGHPHAAPQAPLPWQVRLAPSTPGSPTRGLCALGWPWRGETHATGPARAATG